MKKRKNTETTVAKRDGERIVQLYVQGILNDLNDNSLFGIVLKQQDIRLNFLTS